MLNQTAEKLKGNIDKILSLWELRVNEEVMAASQQETDELRNSLPEYLLQLVGALSKTIDRTSARKRRDKIDSTRIGKRHGEDRAGSKNYTMDQLITEYHILRQVIFDVMESEVPLTDLEREVIICSIEQAVNDAATEYSDILKKLKQKMANTLAHDLRNPIATAKICAELILRKTDENDNSTAKIKMIINNMDRLNQMISELLNASKIEAGESLPIQFKLCDLDAVMKTVISELGLAYLGDLDVKSSGYCEGYWDENGLQRIIENLLTNAVKYGDENKKITLSLEQDLKFANLRVHNFGKAIPSNELPLLFDQFKRATTGKDKAGWGLGLTMVKDMVNAHHGTIHVESDEINGTTFIVGLPKDAREKSSGDVIEIFPPQIEKSENLAKH